MIRYVSKYVILCISMPSIYIEWNMTQSSLIEYSGVIMAFALVSCFLYLLPLCLHYCTSLFNNLKLRLGAGPMFLSVFPTWGSVSSTLSKARLGLVMELMAYLRRFPVDWLVIGRLPMSMLALETSPRYFEQIQSVWAVGMMTISTLTLRLCMPTYFRRTHARYSHLPKISEGCLNDARCDLCHRNTSVEGWELRTLIEHYSLYTSENSSPFNLWWGCSITILIFVCI